MQEKQALSTPVGNPFEFAQFKVWSSKEVSPFTTDTMVLGAIASLPYLPLKVLDIGTGTGALALMMAQKYPTAKVDAIDISEEACNLARFNFQHSPWANRLNVIHGSIEDYDLGNKYDLILCNPPYHVPYLRKGKDESERQTSRDERNIMANTLAVSTKQVLQKEGMAWIIVPYPRESYYLEEFAGQGLHPQNLTWVKHRVVDAPKRTIICLGHESHQSESIKEIVLRNEFGHYSDQYKALTASFHKPGSIV